MRSWQDRECQERRLIMGEFHSDHHTWPCWRTFAALVEIEE